jgi:hypothetical protein
MLIGDWDRHYDQWRWAEYKKKVKLFTGLFHVTETRLFKRWIGNLNDYSDLRHMQTLKMTLKI